MNAVATDLLWVGVVLIAGLAQYGSRNFADLGPPPPAEALPTAPDALGFVLVVTAALAVLLRRRAPLVALTITCGASVATLALGYGVVVHLGPAVVLYEIARRDARAGWWRGGALAVASLVAIAVLEWELLEAHGDFAIDAALWGAAAVLGAGRRMTRAHEAERRRQEQLAAAADERARIARELHDSAGHAITNIVAYAGAARVLRTRDPERADAAIAMVEALAREAIEEIDDLVGALRDDGEAALRPLPGLGDLDELVERQRAGGLRVVVERMGRPRPLPAAVDRASYRIAQEALTNAARHGAGEARLDLRYAATALELTVVNPVATQRRTRRNGGRGLIGMQERAALLGGTLSAAEESERFVLRSTLPYDGAGRGR